jgi:hypothetical protein
VVFGSGERRSQVLFRQTFIQAFISVAFLTSCTGLAGCAGHSLDPIAAEEKQEIKASEAAVAAIDDAKCQSYGFRPGSAGYAQCRRDFDIHHATFKAHE